MGGRETAQAGGEGIQTQHGAGWRRRRSWGSGRKVGAVYVSGVHKVTRRGRAR
jgi:hypothetical protein